MTKKAAILVSIAFISLVALCSSCRDCFMDDLGRIQVALLAKKASQGCTLDHRNQSLTIDDIISAVAQRLTKISGDLRIAGHVAKKIGIRLFNYIKENPVDASIIAGGIVGLYLITSALIRSMTATRCPCCYRVHHHETNNYLADY